jgi:NAD(P)-dependent dehydrogenase (short-subunit alcohol dehydrogenase family)
MRQRTILITGCSTGIGYATANAMAARGWRVFATARKPADVARLSAMPGISAIPLELGDLDSIAACAAQVLAETGGTLDALYNNAAYGLVGAMEDVPGVHLKRHLDVNVVGTHELTRLVLPAMRRQGHGRIVTCSSVLGLVSGPFRGPYCASKYAVEAMSDAMRYELVGTGIFVSLIEPGPIRSEFLASTLAMMKSAIDIKTSPHADTYARRIAAMENDTQSKLKLGPERVVKAVIHATESTRPKVRYRVSPHTHAIAWMKRLLPERALDAVLMRL